MPAEACTSDERSSSEERPVVPTTRADSPRLLNEIRQPILPLLLGIFEFGELLGSQPCGLLLGIVNPNGATAGGA